MIKTIVSGAAGRMGKAIIDLIVNNKEFNDFSLSAAIEAKNNQSIGEKLTSEVEIKDDLEKVIGNADVLIEFTTPQATISHLEIAIKYNKPMVIGTTGFTQEQEEIINAAGEKIKCVKSANMSFGISLLLKLVKDATKILYDYDVEIVESHHRHKKDAPSGTALQIANLVAQIYGKQLSEVGIFGRKGICGPRKPQEIGIHSIRGGEIIGQHSVYFIGPAETLEIVHRVENRIAFAQGALKAARWLVNQNKNGIYSLNDVINL